MLLLGVDHWASPCILPGLQGFSKTLKVRGSKAAKSRLVRDILKPSMIFRPLTPNTTLFPTEFMTQSTLSKLSGRHITLAITGGIAVYKVCELVRGLVKAGATVEVAMTEAATRFVTPLTFEALSGHPVAVDQFAGGMPHLALTRHDTDLLVVAPATANIIAKAACGIADDLVSTIISGRACPMAVVPAMNERMWSNPATQRNIATLRNDGVHVLGPACGELACGVSGAGRMLEPAQIVAGIRRILTTPVLAGRKVVVSAGPTFEPIDPVRGITNLSSGKQGYAIAQAAFEAGADVTLVSGPTGLEAPFGVTVKHVDTALSMQSALEAAVSDADVFISVAAVADWRVRAPQKSKIKKDALGGVQPMIALEENPDILSGIAHAHPELYCVGFAAETENVEANARRKLERKGVSMVVGNDASRALGSDMNSVVFVNAQGTLAFEGISKYEVACRLIECVAKDLNRTRPHSVSSEEQQNEP